MLQKVNTVFVGKQSYVVAAVPGDANALTVGDVVMINPASGNVLTVAQLTTAVPSIQLGLVKSVGTLNKDAEIVKSQIIDRTKITNITENGTCAYVAKTEASSVLDFVGVVPVAGYRYVVRCIYKDLYEHPGQYTQSYEVIAVTGETDITLATKFHTRINAHAGSRVTSADNAAGAITLTAKEVVLNGFATQGKEAITPYSQVMLNVVAYYTVPSTPFNNEYSSIPSLTITTTASKPGRGNKYIVRDREQDALAYKGITYRTEWPVIKPELNVDLSKNYDTLVLEFDKNYQSPDNQYVKSTSFASEVYIDTAGGAGDAEVLRDGIAAWMAL